MSSSRLPGKVLISLAGKTLLDWVVERAQRARLVDEFVLATTVEKQDDLLEEFASRKRIGCYRGSENDVLDRYYRAAQAFNAQVVIRLTADNPIVDGEFVDWVVKTYENISADYVAAIPGEKWRLPMGLAVEVFSFCTLAEAWQQDTNSEWREHVTLFIRNHPRRFRTYYLTAPVEYVPIRLTVDTPEDTELMRKIFEYFGNGLFSWREVLDIAQQHPDWIGLNQSNL